MLAGLLCLALSFPPKSWPCSRLPSPKSYKTCNASSFFRLDRASLPISVIAAHTTSLLTIFSFPVLLHCSLIPALLIVLSLLFTPALPPSPLAPTTLKFQTRLHSPLPQGWLPAISNTESDPARHPSFITVDPISRPHPSIITHARTANRLT